MTLIKLTAITPAHKQLAPKHTSSTEAQAGETVIHVGGPYVDEWSTEEVPEQAGDFVINARFIHSVEAVTDPKGNERARVTWVYFNDEYMKWMPHETLVKETVDDVIALSQGKMPPSQASHWGVAGE